MTFLPMSVASNLYYFHAVENRWMQSVQHVCCAQEKHFRKIDRHVKEVICERVVLLWI